MELHSCDHFFPIRLFHSEECRRYPVDEAEDKSTILKWSTPMAEEKDNTIFVTLPKNGDPKPIRIWGIFIGLEGARFEWRVTRGGSVVSTWPAQANFSKASCSYTVSMTVPANTSDFSVEYQAFWIYKFTNGADKEFGFTPIQLRQSSGGESVFVCLTAVIGHPILKFSSSFVFTL